jgi:hypothetical protein
MGIFGQKEEKCVSWVPEADFLAFFTPAPGSPRGQKFNASGAVAIGMSHCSHPCN